MRRHRPAENLVAAIVRLTLSAILLALATVAAASCTAGGGVCVGSVTRLWRVAADPRGGFVALGSLANSDRADDADVLLRLGPDLSVVGDPIRIGGALASRTGYGRPGTRDLAVRADGGIILVGSARGGGADAAEWRGWFAEVAPTGQVRAFAWMPSRRGLQQVPHRVRILSDGRVLAVGREQAGPDDPGCRMRSDGLLAFYDAGTSTVRTQVLAVNPRARRMAIYDVTERPDDRSLLFAGFESKWDDAERTLCSDDAIVVSADAAGAPRQDGVRRFGDDTADDITFAVAAERSLVGGAVAAGLTGEPVSAPLVARFTAAGQSLGVPSVTPVAGDGWGRFESLVALPAGGAVAVGWRDGDAGREAIWTRLAADVRVQGEPATGPLGSRLLDVAVGRDGTVLAVGQSDVARRSSGWFIRLPFGDGDAAAEAPALKLPPLAAALSRGPIVAGAEAQRFAAEALAAGARVRVPIEVKARSRVELAAVPLGGGVDLSLLGAGGELIDFSINTGLAAEFVALDLQPGAYEAVVDAEADVARFVVSVRAGGAPSTDAAGPAAAEALRRAGYSLPDVAEAASGAALRRAIAADRVASEVTGRRPILAAASSPAAPQDAQLTALLDQPLGPALLNILRPANRQPFFVEHGALVDTGGAELVDATRSRVDAAEFARSLLPRVGARATAADRPVADGLIDAAARSYLAALAPGRPPAAADGDPISAPQIDTIARFYGDDDDPVRNRCDRDDVFLRLAVTYAEGLVAYRSIVGRAYGGAAMFNPDFQFGSGWNWGERYERSEFAMPGRALRIDPILQSPLFPIIADQLIAMAKRFEPSWQARVGESARYLLAYRLLAREMAADWSATAHGSVDDDLVIPDPFGCAIPFRLRFAFKCGAAICYATVTDLDRAVMEFWNRRTLAGTEAAAEAFLQRVADELSSGPLDMAPIHAAAQRAAND